MERAGAARPGGQAPGFLLRLHTESRAEAARAGVQEQDLRQWGLTGIHLRSYQLEGVNWLAQCFHCQNGCILGDEMGLGKTCQTIALFIYLTGRLNDEGPFLILCPLSVLSNWKEEMQRFAPGLSCVTYAGDKEERACLQQDLKQESRFHVLLTTYEICLKDASFLKSFPWSVLVVDEAHRLKNQSSLLHKTLSEFSVVFSLLLTGTPIQNSLQELYSLLSFVEPDLFSKEEVGDFIQRYQDIEKESESASELHKLLQPFLLRRVKAEVATELPKKTEVVIYHGMSALQKKYYKAILMKDLDAFENEMAKKVKLQNILSQLRKCVDHPYLFDGVEPEPFEVGDHLIEASGKLHLLDKLLAFLYSGGHRVLLFSQMTQMLDILQDYIDYRGYSYERVDGSVRGEERHLAIKNFGQQPIFVFLLSTRAGSYTARGISAIFSCDQLPQGGVGMNLTAADTVIFVDSDFNPQNDLQAAARAHRIGQNKSVKVIRLIGRDTVEEIVYRKAASKLQLTNMIIEGGHFTLGAQKPAADADFQVLIPGLVEGSTKRKRVLSPEELEDRQKKRQEAAAKRRRLIEEKKRQKEEAEHKKKMAWWESNNYQSFCLPSEESEPEDLENGEDESSAELDYQDPDATSLKYVSGDVTHPQAGAEDALIVHCVDDSGHWGKGGLFTALEKRSAEPRKIYELAGKMKDLSLGGVLLFPVDDKESRNKGQDLLALIVAQHRDRSNVLSGIKMAALEEGLKKIFLAAKKKKASVHLPRIGHATKGFNWYGTERLIRKHLAARGIPTYIYYFPRSKSAVLHSQSSSSSSRKLVA
ncbi:chromodomain-helicase-DNA-binding protein 1-like isoform X3 [Pongo abelii]|uniref:chromodomain-helicase-DNA-binding protein 1-like isoform X3 n=1 Tax=Pongo abelii TaxID=9601 RepID=UPI0023E88DCD|nr:chromodomain-helicase-DNA-binding protein 1-like isoform X3 [Pongo abelii]